MEFTEAQLKHIAAARKEQDFKRSLKRRLLEEDQRTRNAAVRHRRRITEQGFRALGIDMADVEARHQAANEARSGKHSSIAAELRKHSDLLKARQSFWFKDLVRKHARKHLLPYAASSGLSDVGISAILQDMGHPANAVVSDGPGENLLRFSWNFSTSGIYGYKVASVESGVGFSVTPTLAGDLEFMAPVIYNGSLWCNLFGSCVDEGVSIWFDSQISLIMFQENQFFDKNGSSLNGPTVGWSPSSVCDGGQFATPIDGSVIPQLTIGPIVANVPVTILLYLSIECPLEMGQAIIDFSSGSQCVNVPGVLWGVV
jgi:hypothetical protein